MPPFLAGIATSAAGGLLNYFGNKIGLSQLGGQAESQKAAVGNALDMASAKAQDFLINSNAAGQKGNEARVGYQMAEGAFQPDASLIQKRATSEGIAADLEKAIGDRAVTQQRIQQNQQKRMASDIGNTIGLTGGNANAMAETYKAAAGANNAGALALNEQTGQNAVQGAMAGENIRSNANQQYEQGVNSQYNRDVVPYMNQMNNMQGLAAQTTASAYQGAQDSLINNPLQSLGNFANMYAGGSLGKVLEKQNIPIEQTNQTQSESTNPIFNGWSQPGGLYSILNGKYNGKYNQLQRQF